MCAEGRVQALLTVALRPSAATTVVPVGSEDSRG